MVEAHASRVYTSGGAALRQAGRAALRQAGRAVWGSARLPQGASDAAGQLGPTRRQGCRGGGGERGIGQRTTAETGQTGHHKHPAAVGRRS